MNPSFQTLLFDFDGTLVQSNQIKRDMLFAVAEVLGPEADDLLAEIMAENPHADRFGLYRELLTQLHSENIDATVEQLCGDYAERTIDAISQAPEIPGAGEFLRKLAPLFPLYINSATPEESLRQTLKQRGWDSFFKGIYGRPKSKKDIIDLISEKTGISPEKFLFIGDSEADLEVAMEHGCPFLGIAHEPGWHYDFPPNIPVLDNYSHFFELIDWPEMEALL